MSNAFDDGFDVAPVRDVGHDYGGAARDHHAEYEADRATAAAVVTYERAPAVKIDLSPEAKATLAAIENAERARAADQAHHAAKEIAAATGVSETEAVDAAQPLRSPPPAKGAALFQANLTAEKPKE